jgi:flagella basal body P-ring formation protein FlgA
LCATLGARPAFADSAAQDAAAPFQSIDAIRRAATSLVHRHLGVGTAHTIVTAGELDARLRLERCPQMLEASLPADTAPRSEVTVRVNCPKAGWSVYVPVRVEVDLPVLVLQKPVATGAHISPGDVAADTRRVAGIFSEFVPDVAALNGHHARRMLPAGTVLVADMLAPDPMVVRGQEVTLIAALGALEVRAPGRVLGDAAAASRVQVQNLSSLKIVEGTVESADTVRVAP